MRRAIEFIFGNSLLLMIGAVAGFAWANIHHESFEAFIEMPLMTGAVLARSTGGVVNIHYLVNDVLMAFFFALAGREVVEAFLPRGPLHGLRKAAMPVLSACGGVAVPAALYVLVVWLTGDIRTQGRGWAVPTATDVAFSYVVAAVMIGKRHPAIKFLLLLAIVDDAIGLVLLTAFYPQAPLQPWWLLMVAGGMAVAALSWPLKIRSFVWYLVVPGGMSWVGFAMSGLHPALGLLPVVPLMPHVHSRHPRPGWTFLSRVNHEVFEVWMKNPVEVILGIFGLVNAGVVVTAAGGLTAVVAGSLILGKPVGIFVTGLLSMRLLGLQMPSGMTLRELLLVGFMAGVGFTVAIFVATAAFPPGAERDAARLGAMLSIIAAVLAYAVKRVLGVRRRQGQEEPD
jgi:NhaA family Na+:H+ antiporter